MGWIINDELISVFVNYLVVPQSQGNMLPET